MVYPQDGLLALVRHNIKSPETLSKNVTITPLVSQLNHVNLE